MEHDLNNRYWLFAYDTYYPCGGLNDIEFTFSNPSELVPLLESSKWFKDNYDLFDTKSLKQIELFVGRHWDDESAENVFDLVYRLGGDYMASQEDQIKDIFEHLKQRPNE